MNDIEDAHWDLFDESGCTSPQRVVDLIRWSIHQTSKRTVHLLGVRRDSGKARVSAPIIEMDWTAMKGRTAYGIEYRLCGPAGTDSRVQGLWEFFQVVNHLKAVTADDHWLAGDFE